MTIYHKEDLFTMLGRWQPPPIPKDSLLVRLRRLWGSLQKLLGIQSKVIISQRPMLIVIDDFEDDQTKEGGDKNAKAY